MGADSSMFRGEWRTLKDCAFVDWPAYRGERTLRAVAERLIGEAGIVDRDVVVGHSLGGMVACEIAALRNLRKLILVSSAKDKREVSRLLALLHPLAAITPFRLAQRVADALPGDLYKMFARSDARFIRAACRAIFEWNGLQEGCVPVHRIHGRRDPVIPLPARVDCVVEGRHVIPITHPHDCVNSIRSCCEC